MGIGDWLFLVLVCVSPIPLAGLLLREFIYSFHHHNNNPKDCPCQVFADEQVCSLHQPGGGYGEAVKTHGFCGGGAG